MYKFVVFFLALVFTPAIASGDGLITRQSPYSAGETLDRLEAVLKKKGITIFARVSHTQGAAGVGIELGPTELLIFGNPKLGSHFFTSRQTAGIDLPQIGSGRGSNSPGKTGGHEDFGREQVTGNPDDTLKFRTPTLRNVALTAPYGHGGAYDTLRAVVEHHMDTVSSLYDYNYNRQAVLPTHPTLDAENYIAMDDPDRVDFIAEHNELYPYAYSEVDVDRILDFLNALTDTASIDLRSDQDVVNGVPSGLPLDD